MSWGRAKRTADMIPPLLFPTQNVYNRRAERLRELAENNPLGDYLRFAALIAHAQEVVLYDHPLEMDLTARIKEANDGANRRWISTCCRVISTGKTAAFVNCRAKTRDERPRAGGD